MPLDIMQQQQHFEQYASGQYAGLAQLIDAERPLLFDYLLRMSGQRDGALAASEEGASFVFAAPEKWQSLSQVRLALYAQCRRLLQDSWNADVGRLENEALLAVVASAGAPVSERKRAAAFARLDRAIGQCPAPLREILILHVRCKFTFSDIAKITQLPREQIEQRYGEALKKLRQSGDRLPTDPRSVISQLLPHPIPEKAATELTDLNELIGGIRRHHADSAPNTFGNLLMLLAVVALGVVVFFLLRPEGQNVRRMVSRLLNF